MRRVNLTTSIAQKQLPPAADITLTKGQIQSSVQIDMASRTIHYNTCLCSDANEPGLPSGASVVYDDLDAADKATVDAFLDMVLAHAQTGGHIPAGSFEAIPAP